MIAFLAPDQINPEEAYCKACKELGENDCDNCDPTQIEVIDE